MTVNRGNESSDPLERLQALVGLTAQLDQGAASEGFDAAADFWANIEPPASGHQMSSANVSTSTFSQNQCDSALNLIKEAADYTLALQEQAALLTVKARQAVDDLREKKRIADSKAERVVDAAKDTETRLLAAQNLAASLTDQLEEAHKRNAEASQLMREAVAIIRQLMHAVWDRPTADGNSRNPL